jgi:hypothetical protein
MKVPLPDLGAELPPVSLDQMWHRLDPEETVGLGGALDRTSEPAAAPQSAEDMISAQSRTARGEVVFAAGFLWHTAQDGVRIDQEDGTLKVKPWQSSVGDEPSIRAECPAKVLLPPSGQVRAVRTSDSTLCSLCDMDSN